MSEVLQETLRYLAGVLGDSRGPQEYILVGSQARRATPRTLQVRWATLGSSGEFEVCETTLSESHALGNDLKQCMFDSFSVAKPSTLGAPSCRRINQDDLIPECVCVRRRPLRLALLLEVLPHLSQA